MIMRLNETNTPECVDHSIWICLVWSSHMSRGQQTNRFDTETAFQTIYISIYSNVLPSNKKKNCKEEAMPEENKMNHSGWKKMFHAHWICCQGSMCFVRPHTSTNWENEREWRLIALLIKIFNIPIHSSNLGHWDYALKPVIFNPVNRSKSTNFPSISVSTLEMPIFGSCSCIPRTDRTR